MANRVVCLTLAAGGLLFHEIEEPDVRIACWRGSSVVDVAKLRFPNAIVEEYEFPENVVSEGDADVYINDSITHRFLELNPKLAVIKDSILSKEYVHFAVRLRDHDLRFWLNNWYHYHEAQGTIGKWCSEWWESFMAI